MFTYKRNFIFLEKLTTGLKLKQLIITASQINSGEFPIYLQFSDESACDRFCKTQQSFHSRRKTLKPKCLGFLKSYFKFLSFELFEIHQTEQYLHQKGKAGLFFQRKQREPYEGNSGAAVRMGVRPKPRPALRPTAYTALATRT